VGHRTADASNTAEDNVLRPHTLIEVQQGAQRPQPAHVRERRFGSESYGARGHRRPEFCDPAPIRVVAELDSRARVVARRVASECTGTATD
jgi:hypothetical protein